MKNEMQFPQFFKDFNLFGGRATERYASNSKREARFRTIQQAIDSLVDEGGVIEISEGIFSSNVPLTINNDNIILKGAGAGTIFQKSALWGGGAMISITGDNCILENIFIDGNSQSGTGIVIGSPATKTSIIGCHFFDNDDDGLYAGAGTSAIKILNCHAYDNGDDGICIEDSGQVIIDGCYVYNNTGDGVSFPVSV